MKTDYQRWKEWYEVAYPHEFLIFDEKNLKEVYKSDFKSWWPKMYPNMNK
jgi:hypothetical protein